MQRKRSFAEIEDRYDAELPEDDEEEVEPDRPDEFDPTEAELDQLCDRAAREAESAMLDRYDRMCS